MDLSPLFRWVAATRIREGIAMGLFVALILYAFSLIEDRIQKEREINHVRSYVQEWEERIENLGNEYAVRHAAGDPSRPVVYDDVIRLHSHRAAIEDLQEIVRWRLRHLDGGETHEILTTLDRLSRVVDRSLDGFEDYRPVSWPGYVAQYDCLVLSEIYRVRWLRLGDLHLSYTDCDP